MPLLAIFARISLPALLLLLLLLLSLLICFCFSVHISRWGAAGG